MSLRTYYLQNGALSALPYVCFFLMTFPVSFAADYLINNGHCRLINVRRLFVTLGVICPGLCFVWLSFMGCNSTLAIVALCIMAALNAGKYGGQMMSAHDMCPNYAGSLAAMTVTLGNAAGFLSPIVTGLLTNEQVTMLFCNLNLFLTTISFSANHCSLAEGIPIVRSIHDSGGIGLHILWNS